MTTVRPADGMTFAAPKTELRSKATNTPRERWRMGVEARALVLVTSVLVAFGLAVLLSASAFVSQRMYTFAYAQATGVVLGVLLFAVAAKVDAELWRKLAWPLMGISLFLMLLTAIPGTEAIVKPKDGSRRFLFGGSLQPSELAKFAVLVWVPMLLVKKGDAVRRLGKGLLPFIVVIGALCVMAIREPDYSVALTYCVLTGVLLFVGGARVAHFVFLGALAIPLLIHEMAQSKYASARWKSFVEKEQTDVPRGAQSNVSGQQRQSLIAVGSGGLLGVGYGEGNQQRGWLPLAYNDFIGSVVGEELGFAGLATLTLAFSLYGWIGFRIARRARTPFTSLLAVGLTFTTVLTAFTHIGVVIALLPNTGLTLPFVSYGRSNLVLTLVMTGILVNIGSSRERVYGENATDPLTSASL